jgi:2-iminobutanoate/2-iminopropanoate deaminase
LKSVRIVTMLCLAGMLGSQSGAGQDHASADAPPASAKMLAKLPFSEGIKVGSQIYLSGTLGLDPATGKPPADTSEEARMVMRSIQATLEQGGFSMDDLVSVNIYCTDLSLYSAFNKEYVSFFHKAYPARDFIGVKELLFGAHFEVMGIAVEHASAEKKPINKTP